MTEPASPIDPEAPSSDPVLRLSEALRAARRGLILVVTGAGISVASGLPTFRGTEPDAVWTVSDVEIATEEFFRRDPVTHWSWYRERFAKLLDAAPNPAHRALAALEGWQRERGGELLVVTQNIDTLHEDAGQENLIKVHGTSDRLRCSRDGCPRGAPWGSLAADEVDFAPFGTEPERSTLPRCPECDALLRPHVLFFDELYDGHGDYRFDQVRRALDRASLMLFVGTSFSVGVTDLALRTALFNKTPAWSIDPSSAPATAYPWLRRLEAPSEELLPAVCERLGLGAELASDAASDTASDTASDSGETP